MKGEEKDIELIERYLEESLNPAELIEFEERLSLDEDFKKSFETYKTLINGLKYSGQKQLLQRLKKVEASLTVHESFVKRRWGIPVKKFYSYSAAATILLLLTFTFIFIARHNPSPAEVFEKNFQTYPNVVMPTTRGDNSNKNDKQTAFYLYDSEKFSEAAIHFDRLLKAEKDPAFLLYSALSYMETGNFDLAIERLKYMLNENSDYKVQGEWFISLAYIAKNEPNNAKPYLESLKSQNTSYSKKSAKILEDLQLVVVK